MMDADLPATAAAQIGTLVAQVEDGIIRTALEQLGKGQSISAYQAAKIADYARLHALLRRRLGKEWQTVLDQARAVLSEAVAQGQAAAAIDLTDLNIDHIPAQVETSLRMLTADLLRPLTGLPTFILRDAIDAYQEAAASAVAEMTAGTVTTGQAAARLRAEYARRGIRAFTDRTGRRWQLDTYAEMVVRTGAARAQRYGYEAELISSGQDLVLVSGTGYTCSKCGPWQGTILSLTGQTTPGMRQVDNPLGGTSMVRVAGTMEQAKAAGLFHPNCTHTFTLYIPGVTQPPTIARDQATYEASQRQRALERTIRGEKRVLLATGAKTNAKIRRLQAEIRALQTEYPALARKSDREQVRGYSARPYGPTRATPIRKPRSLPEPGMRNLAGFGKPANRDDLIRRARRMQEFDPAHIDTSRLKDTDGQWVGQEIISDHEIDFWNSMGRLGQHFQLLPRGTLNRDGSTSPEFDAFWHEQGLPVELKRTSPVYRAARDAIKPAARQSKGNFILDFSGKSVKPKILRQLAKYNQRTTFKIDRLWVFDGKDLTEITLE